jgi:TetR/AcrR family transcriptional regulator, tetracycline repressor protein
MRFLQGGGGEVSLPVGGSKIVISVDYGDDSNISAMMRKSRRLPRGSLSRQGIVVAALAVLDRRGVGGLTIRAVARELGSDPTALYRHFRSKSELLSEVGDRLLADVSPPRPEATWREALEEVARQLTTVLTRHGGGVELFAESSYTPAATGLIERTLAHLTAKGLSPALAADALRAVVALSFGHAAQLGAAGRTGFWWELLGAARPPRDFPAIHAVAAGWVDDPDAQFERELSLLLDGIAAS